MVDTVKTRRTHYAVLGLEPTATGDEIEQAFAAAIGIFRPHGFGSVAEATVAFKTLRDPARRRAYDASIGLGSKPEPRPSPMAWRIETNFITATAMPAMRPVFAPEPHVEAQPRTEVAIEPAVEPEATPFIAAALRQLASPEPLHGQPAARTKPQTEPPRASAIVTSEAPQAGAERRTDLAAADDADEPLAGATPWKRAGIIAGGLAAAVALFGAWAGWDSVGSAEPVENSATAVLPPPTTYTVGDPAAAAPDRVIDEARTLPPKRTARSAVRPARARTSSRLADLERQLAAASPVAAPENPAEQAAGVAPVPTAAAASLPLSNRVIARTIERIGYRCGEVASATSGGTPGVFTVTCTSGHSYRASPVRGRYHFRRLSGG